MLIQPSQVVADQLYSLSLTAVIGVSGPIGLRTGFRVYSMPSAEPEWRTEIDRVDIIRVSVWNFINQLFLTCRLVNPAPLNMPSPVSKPRTLYDKIWDDHVMYVTLYSRECPMLIPIHLQVTHRMMGSP